MKIIASNKITGVTGSTEDAEYPDDNVLDDFRMNPWQAVSAVESTLTINIAANSNAIAMSYMNSATVTVEVKDNGGSTIYGPTAHAITINNPNLWVDYTAQALSHSAVLTFSNPGVAPYCGVVRAGTASEFNSLFKSMREGLKDTSIKHQYNNVARYYKNRDRLRKFSGTFKGAREDDFYRFMHDIVKVYGEGPYFFKLTGETGNEFVVFGWLDGMPDGTHSTIYSRISANIEEGL